MKAAVIVNAHAASGVARLRWPRAARMLARRLGQVEVRFTRKAGDAAVLAAELASAGFDPVIAAGGDGTMNEVINGLLSTGCDVRAGVLPIASGGDFARTLGLGGLSGAVETLAAGYCRRVDVIRTRFQGPDGETERHCINMASIGLGGLVAQAVQEGWRFMPGGLRYLAACIPRLAAGCVFKVRLFLDGVETGTFDVTIVSLANGRYQGGGILIAPAAAIDNGLIHITLVEQVSLAEVVRHLPILYSGEIYTYPKVRHWQAKRVRVEALSAAPLELDGEPVGTVPVEAELLPQVLRLVCRAPEENRPKGTQEEIEV
jgi:YegS/Rv2252/BmrU family lipid kinase